MKFYIITLLFVLTNAIFAFSNTELNTHLSNRYFNESLTEQIFENQALLLDSVYVNSTSDDGKTFWLSNKYYYYHDDAGKLLHYLSYMRQSKYEEDFYPAISSFYSYNENGRTIEQIIKNYSQITQKLENMTKFNYIYNDQDKLIERLVSDWNNQDEDWAVYSRILLTYDENNLCTMQENFVYKAEIEDWKPTTKELLFYDDDQQIIYLLMQNQNEESEWFSSGKYTYLYDENGNNIENEWFIWDFESEDWVYARKYLMEFNEMGGETQFMKLGFLAHLNKWIPEDRYDYYRNSYNSIDSTYSYSWDTITEDWRLIQIVNYFRSERTLSNETPAEDLAINVFPNPSNGLFRIYVQNPNMIYNLTIYNSLGQNILIQKINDNDAIDLEGFSSGVYYFLIQGNDGTTIVPVLKR